MKVFMLDPSAIIKYDFYSRAENAKPGGLGLKL